MRDRTGNYELMYELGRGGMGQVWSAVRLGREGVVMPCAIKVLHPSLAQTETERQRFFNEARIAAQLDHGRIVKVTDTSEVQGAPCLVMEWVDGVNLRDFTEKVPGPIDLDVCLYIVGEILAALEYAHDRTVAGADAGVIHYDVTPGNILISSSGEVKLTDFGIARFSSAADGTMSRSMGTPRYMSAEQLNGKACKETDIYSLGVVLHELLAGGRYLDGCDRQQLQMLVLDGYIPELDRPNMPAWVDQLRRRMLARDPAHRPSADEALALILQETPRYHLASKRVRDLYRDHVGERRSGLTKLVDTEDVPGVFRRRSPVPAPVPQHAEPSDGGQPDTNTGMPSFEPSITVTEVLEPPVLEPPVLEPPMPEPPVSPMAHPVIVAPPQSRRWLVGGLAATCLLLAGIVVGLLVARDDREDAVPQPHANEQPMAAPPVPAEAERQNTDRVVDPVPPVEPAPAAEIQQPEVEPEPAPEPEPKSEPVPDPERPPPKASPRKVEVTFVIKGATKAQLEIGSRSLAYDHIAMTELRPGRHSVRWRASDDEPWHDAGTITVEALTSGAYYEVEVGATSVRIEKRDAGSVK